MKYGKLLVLMILVCTMLVSCEKVEQAQKVTTTGTTTTAVQTTTTAPATTQTPTTTTVPTTKTTVRKTQKTTKKTTVAKTTESSTTVPKTVEIPDKLYCPDGSLKPLTYSAEKSKLESDILGVGLSVYTTADGDEATYYKKSGYLWSVYYADTTIEKGPIIEKDKQKDYAYRFAKNFVDTTNYTMFSRVDSEYTSLYFSREAQSVKISDEFYVAFLNGQIAKIKYFDPLPYDKHFETFENADISKYDAQFENDLKEEYDCSPDDYELRDKIFFVEDDEPYIVYNYVRTNTEAVALESKQYLID